MNKSAFRKGLLLQLATLEYEKAWDLQRTLAQARRDKKIPDTLFLVEHPHSLTIGRSGSRNDVLINDFMLKELGISLHYVDRGGQVTYHGPGQLVGYPIIDLRGPGHDVLHYLRSLEQFLISTLQKLGVFAKRIPGYTGVWVGEEKIASIGIKVAQGVTTHGFALNVNTDLSYFGYIVPCGLADKTVTSLEAIIGKPIRFDTIIPVIASCFESEFGVSLEPTELLTILHAVSESRPINSNQGYR